MEAARLLHDHLGNVSSFRSLSRIPIRSSSQYQTEFAEKSAALPAIYCYPANIGGGPATRS
ncbi:Uncharacterised protein [Vibrio cholerae]|nr:Uncharacterised protein [Vibrio cholerae]